MNIKEVFITAIKELRSNYLRSFLTMLGIIIGIAAIIAVMAIGGGARELIINQMEIFGSDLIAINPGKEPSGLTGFAQVYLKKSLKEGDYKALLNKENVPDAELVVPSLSGSAPVNYENDVVYADIIGSNEYAAELFQLSIIEGNNYSKSDVTSANKVAIIGESMADDLFGLQDPVGKKIKIKGALFRVVGVFSSKSASFLGFDKLIITPYTSAMRYILGIKYFQEIDIRVSSVDKIDAVVKDVETLLRSRHNIKNPENDDFFITTPDESIKSVSGVFDAITVFLGLVAAISLIVGGIGMMNIMFISVTQRTREIGLRKALGATNKNIFLQFLTESSIITLLGGVFGILFGALLTWLISSVASRYLSLDFPFYISPVAIFLGVFVSAAVGAVFGIRPALKAARKDPVESLRYE